MVKFYLVFGKEILLDIRSYIKDIETKIIHKHAYCKNLKI